LIACLVRWIFTGTLWRKEFLCSSYELLPDAESGIDQLLWWKDHTHQFPLLSYLARVVMAVPAASRQHRDPQEGLLEPCQSGAAHHREVQHDAAERIWEESVDR